ncbi:MAG: patatin family protein, partial [Clostridia bacterium]|nr:patatin family protein [Clostridia bacterium]
MKIGLVMEGGAMRGMFTAGVIDVMMERGIAFDGAIGVSAGAVFGCNYKSHQIGRVIRYNKKYCRDKRYVSMRSLFKTGNLYGVEFAYHLLPEKLDPFDTDTFENSPMEFYVVCTDADTGEPVYHKCEKGDAEDLEWMRASATMPLAGDIVNIGGRNLSDGGTADSIPIEFFRSIGYEKNVVILTQPSGYKKTKNRFLPL